jgi:hypothetical protein
VAAKTCSEISRTSTPCHLATRSPGGSSCSGLLSAERPHGSNDIDDLHLAALTNRRTAAGQTQLANTIAPSGPAAKRIGSSHLLPLYPAPCADGTISPSRGHHGACSHNGAKL